MANNRRRSNKKICNTLRIAALIVGLTFLVYFLLFFVASFISEEMDLFGEDSTIEEHYRITIIISLIIYVLFLISNILFIVGLLKNIRGFVLTFLVMFGINIFMVIFSVTYDILVTDSPDPAMVVAFCSSSYLLICLFTFMWNLGYTAYANIDS